jgi:hypothetical protein
MKDISKFPWNDAETALDRVPNPGQTWSAAYRHCSQVMYCDNFQSGKRKIFLSFFDMMRTRH